MSKKAAKAFQFIAECLENQKETDHFQKSSLTICRRAFSSKETNKKSLDIQKILYVSPKKLDY